MLYLVTRGRALGVHLSAVIALDIGAGLVMALATSVVVGAFTSSFLAIWGVAALFALALALHSRRPRLHLRFAARRAGRR